MVCAVSSVRLASRLLCFGVLSRCRVPSGWHGFVLPPPPPQSFCGHPALMYVCLSSLLYYCRCAPCCFCRVYCGCLSPLSRLHSLPWTCSWLVWRPPFVAHASASLVWLPVRAPFRSCRLLHVSALVRTYFMSLSGWWLLSAPPPSLCFLFFVFVGVSVSRLRSCFCPLVRYAAFLGLVVLYVHIATWGLVSQPLFSVLFRSLCLPRPRLSGFMASNLVVSVPSTCVVLDCCI